MKPLFLLPIFILCFINDLSNVSAELLSTIDDQTHLAVTIYNENLALVKDQRQVTLKKGINHLALRGVSAHIRPETALLRNLSPNSAMKVLEQNFDFDLLTPQKLLEKYIGRQVKLARTNPVTGIETIEAAQVLSTNNGVVLKMGDKIVTNPHGEYIFDNVPANLRDKPTLVTQLDNDSDNQQTLELAYLTGGLSWKADYVAQLSHDDKHLDLTGWVTLTNQSGTSYPNAQLQLVAGDVNLVKRDFIQALPRSMMKEGMIIEDKSGMSEERLFEYHLYTLGRTTTLADKQTKQVALLSANSVPITKEFLLQGQNYYYAGRYGALGHKLKASVFIAFLNKERSGLGMPIPKGIIRVYKNDSKGHTQFVGEDRIDHTPKNEKIRLKLGDAFDVTADKKQTDFKKVSYRPPYQAAYESAYEIKIKNVKSNPVTVTVREPISGEWKIVSENHPHKKVTSGMAEWNINVPAESTQTLRYQVLVQY